MFTIGSGFSIERFGRNTTPVNMVPVCGIEMLEHQLGFTMGQALEMVCCLRTRLALADLMNTFGNVTKEEARKIFFTLAH